MLCYLCSKKPRQLGGAKINYVRLLEQEPTEFVFIKLSEHARWQKQPRQLGGAKINYVRLLEAIDGSQCS